MSDADWAEVRCFGRRNLARTSSAMTCVPAHAKFVELFADNVSMGSRVRPLVRDVGTTRPQLL